MLPLIVLPLEFSPKKGQEERGKGARSSQRLSEIFRMRCSIFREQENGAFGKYHAFARVTPVIFVVSRVLSSKVPVLPVRTQIRHFRRFRQKSPLLRGTKARFTKGSSLGPRQKEQFLRKIRAPIKIKSALPPPPPTPPP